MPEPKPLPQNEPENAPRKSGERGATAAGENPPDAEAAAANQLTPEEQLARYEQELKEKDWGHQPC